MSQLGDLDTPTLPGPRDYSLAEPVDDPLPEPEPLARPRGWAAFSLTCGILALVMVFAILVIDAAWPEWVLVIWYLLIVGAFVGLLRSLPTRHDDDGAQV